MGAKLDGNVLVMKQIIVSGEKETLNSDIEIQLSKINLALKSINT